MERTLAILVLMIVGILFLATTHRTFVIADIMPAAATSSGAAATVEAIDTASTAFAQTGTLVFYPNNVGPVPYLFYQDARGTTVAKALVFSALPLTDFSTWSGARVAVKGVLEREHVLVSEIQYLSPP